jgi:hypothetical protein
LLEVLVFHVSAELAAREVLKLCKNVNCHSAVDKIGDLAGGKGQHGE